MQANHVTEPARQSRRVHGEYTFTLDDLTSSHHFEDGIARLGCYLTSCRNNYTLPGLNYDVPCRCLVLRQVEGLLVAGRCPRGPLTTSAETEGEDNEATGRDALYWGRRQFNRRW